MIKKTPVKYSRDQHLTPSPPLTKAPRRHKLQIPPSKLPATRLLKECRRNLKINLNSQTFVRRDKTSLRLGTRAVTPRAAYRDSRMRLSEALSECKTDFAIRRRIPAPRGGWRLETTLNKFASEIFEFLLLPSCDWERRLYGGTASSSVSRRNGFDHMIS